MFGTVGQPSFLTGSYGGGAAGFGNFIGTLPQNVIAVIGLIFFFYLLFAAFKYMTAGGDDKAVGEAKKMLTNASIGLGIAVGAYFLAEAVGVLLGVDILTPVFTGP